MKILTKISHFFCAATIISSSLSAQDGIHPLMKMENVYPENDVMLKVSAMCFMGDQLYVTVFTPDRLNTAPFKEGEVFRISGLIDGDGPIFAEKIMGNLYEPTAITSFAGKLYIGEKDKISRLDDKNNDGKYTDDEKTILINGISAPNFHTFTIGFEKITRDGKTYLAGNLTTSVKLGGAREFNLTVNPKTRRGSTFVLGPINGTEKAEDVDIEYLAGGFRTPNGFTVTLKDQAAIVVDNQGVFNPSNKFIRITKGGFYGHYLMEREDSNVSAFQPKETDAGAKYQLPPTVHMPQESVARSPAQPLEIHGKTGALSVYNGHFLVPDVTLGTITRIFLEEVEGTWQGAVFKHSGGYDKAGEKGFTAGPNRMVQGPDGKYYIGEIGHGGLWRMLSAEGDPLSGLQRLSFHEEDKLPESFNEMVAVRDHKEGLEIEFFSPLESAPKIEDLTMRQWTYIPTAGYGGPEAGQESLTPKSLTLSEDGKRLLIAVDGLRDNSPPFLTENEWTNENNGWVVNIRMNDKTLWANEVWYTMHKHMGETSQRPIEMDADLASKDPIKFAQNSHAAVCAACHAIDGKQLVGPNFKGLLGRKQKVIGRDQITKEITVDEDYIISSILDPTAAYPEGFPPAMPNPGLSEEQARAITKWITTLK
ncbi:MAG: c-type cytochrome [Verrucomicrobiota bacterium]